MVERTLVAYNSLLVVVVSFVDVFDYLFLGLGRLNIFVNTADHLH